MTRDHQSYRQILNTLREQFPQPISNRVHDAYVVFSILRAIDRVDALKGDAPILGTPTDVNYPAALSARTSQNGLSVEQVVEQLVNHLQGMFIWGHPQSQINVIPNPTIAGVIGVLLASTYNPNLCSDESGRGFSAAEVKVCAMAADLTGFDPSLSGGVFTFGGTGTLLYAVKVGIEKACPGTLHKGLKNDVVVLGSEHGHYSIRNVAGWLGIGQDQVISIRTHENNSMDLAALGAAAREALGSGKKLAAIVATMGSTDSFGLDDLKGIVAIRDELVKEFSLDYRPHVHADAVIGWAWSVFKDYSFLENPLEFRGRTVRALAAAHRRISQLGLADSIGIDFHKTGYCPYVSSLVLFRDKNDFRFLCRPKESMPYLYQSGEYHPGMYTLETSRSGTGPMAALANLLLFGKQGLRVLLGHAVEMAEVLREGIESHPDLTVVNDENVGPVTLFRVYPPGVDTFSVKERERRDPTFQSQLAEYNELNRQVFQRVHEDALTGEGVVISMTDCYRNSDHGVPIVALKSYLLSPFADEGRTDAVIRQVIKSRDEVLALG